MLVTSAGAGFGDRTVAAVEWSKVQHEPSVSPPERTTEHPSAPQRPAAPVRTCIGCRKRELAAELLRIVAREDDDGDVVAIVPDTRRRLPGRGAWLHPVSACLSTAVRRRAIGRALRVSGHLDISALEHYLENRHEHS
ncbi:YlxR family protein [Nocardia cyriacigeorgica]|uniref:YlxR family protein n=1 Tax=Nocardia cyriacigeorgica TaxID=135487 RepID=A0A6P1DB96_9NOCA|nr:YlxR family protein [Nocardia cyriacigeorgica]NEW47408.1 YlxR family protein [Nocardia cyriacigeorgica]NEW49816.1 YlxR family protein [Nocardia cyriacigeorgica]NEW54551.1 YlxR family protein [Nocardia cyriacigeorgica]